MTECCTCGRIAIAIQDDFDADELGLDPEEELTECCTCGRIAIAIQDDFDADELGLDPEEEYDA